MDVGKQRIVITERWETDVVSLLPQLNVWREVLGHGTERENPGKVLQRARYGERGMKLPPPRSAPLSPNLPVLTNPEALQILSLWDFMEASLHRHD